MNSLSINIRGLGGDFKPNWIKGIVYKENVSFLAIQESQVGGVSIDRINKYWGKKSMEYELIEPSGRSRGLISIWDPSIFKVVEVTKKENFLICKGSIKGCVNRSLWLTFIPLKKTEIRSVFGTNCWILKIRSVFSPL